MLERISSKKPTVMKFDGTNWVAVGSPGFTSGQASYMSFAMHNGIPYIAYQDSASSNKATVMKFANDPATFQDVSVNYWAWRWIESIYAAGITGGCSVSPLNYCPTSPVTRAQMAVFLEKGVHGNSFTPADVPPTFNDTAGHWAEDWIEALKADAITSGCGDGNYCPESPVTRAQMAVFLLKAKYGQSYNPPPVGGSTGFADVPIDHWAAAWIKQLAAENITSGCGGGNYCPDNPVTRDQMAVFLQKSFNLPLP